MKKVSERAMELTVKRDQAQEIAKEVYGYETWYEYCMAKVPGYPRPNDVAVEDVLRALDEWQKELGGEP